jgi:hypothetical protein
MDEIRKIIREELENIFEDFKYIYDGEFTPTDEMVSIAKKALETISLKNLINNTNSNEGSGKNKAKSICNKDSMTHAQVKRMKAYFDNHCDEVVLEKSKGKNLENSGILQSWDLWGGDAGKSWAERIISQKHSKNNTSKKVRGASGIRTKNLMNPLNTRIHK